MGAKVSVRNNTPYIWYYSNSSSGGFRSVYPGCTEQYDEKRDIWCYIYLRYHSHDWNSFGTEYNSHKGDPTFTISESWDRSQIQWHCSTEGSVATCPNYGKQEEDQRQQEQQRRQQQQEERRRQERLERERRIQEEIDRESEISREKLSRSREKLRQKQSFKGQVHHHERTQVLHQQIEDDAAAIERNELADVEQKFKELLSKYKITESEDLQDCGLEDRIKTLHNELTVQYCRENKLPVWSQFTFDHAVGYEELSLTEKLTILEAVLKLTLQGTAETEDESDHLLHWDKKYEFLFCLVEELYVTNPTLAEPIFLRILDAVSELLPKSRETLVQILFNNIWTPTEIMLFIRKASSIDHNQIPQVLHMVQTYRLSCLLTLSALKKQEPLMFLQQQVREDKDKDTDTILRELCESQCPENILTVIEDVLRHMETELPKYQEVDLTEKNIEDLKIKIKSLDCANPDINTLKEVLIGMSVAVQDSTTNEPKGIKGYFPRQTQLASLLLLLLSQLTENKGCLLEIGTGEGKSAILAMFATIQAIRGIKVDIVTSSPVLARRDQEEWKKFFEKFGVTSSVVPPPLSKQSSPVEPDKLLEEAYKQQVVYGTVGAFAADTLKQEFERRTTRGTRGFELVIVDEVDYMTLDNGVQVTFLSHEASSLRHMDQILANIWTMTSTCQPIEMLDTGEIKWATRIQHFHKAATSAVMGSEPSDSFSAFDILLPGVDLGFYSSEDIEMLRQAMSKTETENTGDDYQDDGWRAIEQVMKKIGVSQQYDLLRIFQEVMENSVAFECYSEENNKAKRYRTEERHADLEVSMLLLENGLACEIMSEKSLIEATVSAVKSYIKYSDECSYSKENGNFIYIPHFLRKYVENQLPVFVENALRAIEMTQGREYMIDISRAAAKVSASDPDQHQYDAIIPVDFKASGVLEKNKKWGNGLQQFLEMKHQLAISPLSSVTNYMSNCHYFKRYIHGNGIFGVSGTLGGDADKDFLKRHYKTKSYTIPAHRHKKVVELPALQVNGGNDQWIQTVCDTTWKAASRGQVVLVICEDVKTANELHVKMQDEERFKPHQITMYTISERHNIERDKFSGGRIIIATNLGGRGTDIKVEEKVNECGGLFVLLTHFPRNRRVEKQIFGRTARKGNPGMVQMVLNQDHLAPAYQGQSVEIMRQLREEYEVKRISEMESDELVEIDLKGELFTTFCQSLKDFEQNYTEEERKDLSQLEPRDIPDHLRDYQAKFDYQPALNALKEAWALWLTLHEEHINRHDDIHDLQTDLIKTMNETKGKLLQGESDNFYDHIKQAILRTDLHCRDKTNDYGAKSYWQRAATSDPLYKAVALYNQAYITINLAKDDYKAEARKLLEQAKEPVDVYISETSNTMVSCQMSVNDNLKPHRNNFQSQMEARMNIFKSWKTYIDNALKKLVKLEEGNSGAKTKDCSVYMLLKEKDFIITNELMALYELGLAIVFEVEEKPKFCFDALICFFIGAIQVLAGVLVCAFSFGTASQFGLGLISEGVSDMISGIEGMVKGTFSWAEWAINKSISIGISLLTAGFSAIKKAVTSMDKVKSLLNGTKSFTTVTSGTAESAISSFGREAFGISTSSTVLKQNFKHAAKYAVQEITKQAVVTGLNYAVDEGLKAIFEDILNSAFKDVVTSAVKQNRDLDKAITDFISSHVPKAAMQKDSFKIGKLDEEEMTKTIAVLTEDLIPDLMMDCTTVHEVISGLTKVCNGVGITGAAKLCLTVADQTTRFIEILNSVPTKRVIDETFVPTLLSEIEELQRGEKYDQDGRHNLQDVKRLKGKILSTLADSVSQAFIKACSGHMTSLLTKPLKSKFNKATGEAVGNIMGRHKTQSFFDDQRHKHNMRSASRNTEKSLTEKERMDLMDYMEHISNVDHPATDFDIIVLTKSGLLNGRGIHLTVIDEHGNRLSEERYKGTDESAGNITLQLTKRAKDLQPPEKSSFFSWIKAKITLQEPQFYSGHFDIVQDDGTVVNVNSEHQNSLYHAIAQATGSDRSDLKGAAVKLHEKVKNEVQENFASYTPILKLQRGYDYSHKNPGKYTITGGAKPGGASHSELLTKEEYLKSTSFIETDECDIIRSYKLASVEKYKRLRNARGSENNSGTVNADHVPSKDSIRKAWERTKDKPELQEQLKNSNPKLYEMIENIKDDKNGLNLIAMEVLAKDHKRALTMGASHQAKKCRELLAESLVSGDVETMLKQSMIVAHPLTSQELMADLGENRRPHHNEMSKEGIRGYYKAGYTNLVTVYSRQGLIDQNQKDQLMEWLNQDKHEDKNTPEYLSIRDSLK
ncbi:uncharacterized protein LOC122981723 isoform X1 [Thunnus albacares]|uniref:uncharacterized protein LOC122981723 isoform X1 n=1 Tax=Thunnus albacares TaxID=8236 RepID=UPI001CF61CB9|nr:uncharacterized protein LOC122981723 isoform X1 [Thunnus albacares]